MKKTKTKDPPHSRRYITGIPRKPLPEGRVLVHNHVIPSRILGWRGFRAWTQMLDGEPELVPCPCNWCGVDLRGLPHYRVKAYLPEGWRFGDDPAARKHNLELLTAGIVEVLKDTDEPQWIRDDIAGNVPAVV
jgi:hypothetical protein